MKQSSYILPLALGLAGTLLLSNTSQAGQEVTTALGLPMSANLIVDESACDNSPGPWITVSGVIKLGAVNARLLFSNNVKGTHSDTVDTTYDVTLLPAGGEIVLHKQPSLGGVGGNPHILLQLHDGEGNDYTEPYYLGRCVQGLEVNAKLLNAILARLTVEGDCSNNPGPWITMDGDLTLSGVHARLIFANNAKLTHNADATVDIVLVSAGSKIVLPKQPSHEGVTGNPRISIQFLSGDWAPLGEPLYLGRCVQL
jgi:hypothetical protein